MGIYDRLLIHSPVYEHVGCFQFGVINNGAVTLAYTSFCEHRFSFLYCKYPGLGLLGHMVNVCLILYEPAKLFSQWLNHFAFPLQWMRVPVAQHSSYNIPNSCQQLKLRTLSRDPWAPAHPRPYLIHFTHVHYSSLICGCMTDPCLRNSSEQHYVPWCVTGRHG